MNHAASLSLSLPLRRTLPRKHALGALAPSSHLLHLAPVARFSSTLGLGLARVPETRTLCLQSPTRMMSPLSSSSSIHHFSTSLTRRLAAPPSPRPEDEEPLIRENNSQAPQAFNPPGSSIPGAAGGIASFAAISRSPMLDTAITTFIGLCIGMFILFWG